MASGGNTGCASWVGIGFAWLLAWYFMLDAAYRSATQGLRQCAWYEVVGACASAWGKANGNFMFGMVIATLSIPLPVLLWRKAQALLAQGGDVLAERQARAARERGERAAEQQIALIGVQAATAKSRLERGEFIQSLGAVCDYLDILPHESEPSRILQIRQGISKELRDIIATYTLTEMAQIIREDDALCIKLKSMLATLKRRKVASSDADVLREAMALASAKDA